MKSIETTKKTFNLNEVLKDNIIVILCIIGVLLFQIHYLIISTRNVPIMDYWTFINDLGEKIMTGKLSFQDIWTSYNSQKNPLMLILFAINMRIFGYNTQIEIFLGILFQLFSSLCIIYAFKKENFDKISRGGGRIVFQLLSSTFLLAFFSLNQWEILTLEFSLVFMLRIFSYILIFVWLNHCLFDMQNCKKQLNIISILVPIIICLMSQLYFVAFIGTIGIVVFIHFCINYNKEKFLYFKNYLYLGIAAIIGTIIYLINLDYESTVNNISISVLFVNFIKGILLMLGASLWQSLSVYPLFGVNSIYISGVLVAVLYIFAIVLYFRKNIYRRTYIPLFLILYCFITVIMIYYGRAYRFDLYYLTASRYTCETMLGLAGILWIFADEVFNTQKSAKHSRIIKFSALFSIVIIVVGLVCALLSEKHIGFFRGHSFADARGIMRKVDTVSDEELNIFQNNPSKIRNSIGLLKKYNLSVFKGHDTVGTSKNNIEYYGFYEKDFADGVWITGNASIIVEGETVTHFSLTGYQPASMPVNYLTVTINFKEYIIVEMIPEKIFNVELDFDNTLDMVYISLKTEKTFIPRNEGWNNDARELGAFILSWELTE